MHSLAARLAQLQMEIKTDGMSLLKLENRFNALENRQAGISTKIDSNKKVFQDLASTLDGRLKATDDLVQDKVVKQHTQQLNNISRRLRDVERERDENFNTIDTRCSEIEETMKDLQEQIRQARAEARGMLDDSVEMLKEQVEKDACDFEVRFWESLVEQDREAISMVSDLRAEIEWGFAEQGSTEGKQSELAFRLRHVLCAMETRSSTAVSGIMLALEELSQAFETVLNRIYKIDVDLEGCAKLEERRTSVDKAQQFMLQIQDENFNPV